MEKAIIRIEYNGRKYELSITDPEIDKEIGSILLNKDISDVNCILLLGGLFNELDPEFAHALLLSVFKDDETILEMMFKCPIEAEKAGRFLNYFRMHWKP